MYEVLLLVHPLLDISEVSYERSVNENLDREFQHSQVGLASSLGLGLRWGSCQSAEVSDIRIKGSEGL